MDKIKSEVIEAFGLSIPINRETASPSLLEERETDEVRCQNSNGLKRKRPPRLSIPESYANDIPHPPKRHKLPSEAPAHRRRGVSFPNPKRVGSKWKIVLPPPIKPPIRTFSRPSDPTMLWAKWKPTSLKRRGKLQKNANDIWKPVNLRERKVNSKPKTWPSTKGSFTPEGAKDEFLPSLPSPPSDTEPAIEEHLSAKPAPCGSMDWLKVVLNPTDTSGVSGEPNETNVGSSSPADQEPIEANPPSAVLEFPNNTPQAKRSRPEDEEADNKAADNERPHKSPKLFYFSQADLDDAAYQLVDISIVCVTNPNPDKTTLEQLQRLLENLSAALAFPARKNDLEEHIAFRAALDNHELHQNWDNLDSFADLRIKIAGILKFEPRLVAPKLNRNGEFVV